MKSAICKYLQGINVNRWWSNPSSMTYSKGREKGEMGKSQANNLRWPWTRQNLPHLSSLLKRFAYFSTVWMSKFFSLCLFDLHHIWITSVNTFKYLLFETLCLFLLHAFQMTTILKKKYSFLDLYIEFSLTCIILEQEDSRCLKPTQNTPTSLDHSFVS